MKTKLNLLIAIIALMATTYGCKRSVCCMPPETNHVIALLGTEEWRTTGYLYQQNNRKDTVLFSASIGQERLVIYLKKSGSGYIMTDARFYNITGDIVNADYVLDTSKNSSFNTLTLNDDLLEGSFNLYFKLNHGNATFPATLVFKNGVFRIQWANVPPASTVLHG